MKKTIRQVSMVLVLLLIMTVLFVFSTSADTTDSSVLYYGDVDMDGRVTIKDATTVQKGVAGIVYLTSVQRFLAEPETYEVTVKTATEIQKYLTGFDDKYYYHGTEKQLPVSTLFTSKIKEDDEFTETEILVYTHSKFGEMTLEDFTEYEFVSIRCIAESIDNKYNYYSLTLKNPGRENVLDAIESLTYRGNIDIMSVMPNYIFHID